jgi:hypothetical protein
MDIRDALMDSMIEKRWALRDAIDKRQKLDKLIARGKTEDEARAHLEALGQYVESGNRVIVRLASVLSWTSQMLSAPFAQNKPLPGWQGLDLSPPKTGQSAAHH